MGKKSKTKETIEQAGKPISSDSEMNGLTFSHIGVLSLSVSLSHSLSYAIYHLSMATLDFGFATLKCGCPSCNSILSLKESPSAHTHKYFVSTRCGNPVKSH